MKLYGGDVVIDPNQKKVSIQKFKKEKYRDEYEKFT